MTIVSKYSMALRTGPYSSSGMLKLKSVMSKDPPVGLEEGTELGIRLGAALGVAEGASLD